MSLRRRSAGGAWLTLALLAPLLALALRDATVPLATLDETPLMVPSDERWSPPAGALAQTLSLLGMVPLCARRGALRIRGRG